MPVNDPGDLDRVDQEIRVNELKCELADVVGGEAFAWEAADCPPGLAGQFWENVVAYERAPKTSNFEQLLARGVELPPPDRLGDAEVHAKLWEVIRGLADLRVYLSHTDHLSDRELYDRLWSELLREVTVEAPFPDMVCHLDVVGSGSEEDIEVWLKYHAGDDARADWQRNVPDAALPDRETPRFDRDGHLPSSPLG